MQIYPIYGVVGFEADTSTFSSAYNECRLLLVKLVFGDQLILMNLEFSEVSLVLRKL